MSPLQDRLLKAEVSLNNLRIELKKYRGEVTTVYAIKRQVLELRNGIALARWLLRKERTPQEIMDYLTKE